MIDHGLSLWSSIFAHLKIVKSFPPSYLPIHYIKTCIYHSLPYDYTEAVFSMASPQNNENYSDAFTAAKRIHSIYQQVLKTFR